MIKIAYKDAEKTKRLTDNVIFKTFEHFRFHLLLIRFLCVCECIGVCVLCVSLSSEYQLAQVLLVLVLVFQLRVWQVCYEVLWVLSLSPWRQSAPVAVAPPRHRVQHHRSHTNITWPLFAALLIDLWSYRYVAVARVYSECGCENVEASLARSPNRVAAAAVVVRLIHSCEIERETERGIHELEWASKRSVKMFDTNCNWNGIRDLRTGKANTSISSWKDIQSTYSCVDYEYIYYKVAIFSLENCCTL